MPSGLTKIDLSMTTGDFAPDGSVDLSGASSVSFPTGTFTPRLYGSGTDGGATHTTQEGSYQLVGKFVTCNIRLALSAKNTMAGQVRMDGLPFNIVNDIDKRPVVLVGALSEGFDVSGETNATGISAWGLNNSNDLYFVITRTTGTGGGGVDTLQATEIDDDFTVYLTFTYEVA